MYAKWNQLNKFFAHHFGSTIIYTESKIYTLITGLKKGIKQVADMSDINGNLYQFDVLKEIYGINGTFLCPL